jgi:hypothetical protein
MKRPMTAKPKQVRDGYQFSFAKEEYYALTKLLQRVRADYEHELYELEDTGEDWEIDEINQYLDWVQTVEQAVERNEQHG